MVIHSNKINPKKHPHLQTTLFTPKNPQTPLNGLTCLEAKNQPQLVLIYDIWEKNEVYLVFNRCSSSMNLFVTFRGMKSIKYSSMVCVHSFLRYQKVDVNQKVVYWEPKKFVF